MSSSLSQQNPHLKEKLLLGILELEIEVDELKVEKLLLYLSELLKWNRVYNLTGIKDLEGNISKNLLDCLALMPHINGEAFLDVGTGAGLPGMILAIANPQQHWTLLDSNAKKTSFLIQIKQLLSLGNVDVATSRIESLQTDKQFDGITTRAFDSIPASLQLCDQLLVNGSKFYAMKGKLLNKDLGDLPAWASVEEVVPLKVRGLEEERHVVKIAIQR